MFFMRKKFGFISRRRNSRFCSRLKNKSLIPPAQFAYIHRAGQRTLREPLDLLVSHFCQKFATWEVSSFTHTWEFRVLSEPKTCLVCACHSPGLAEIRHSTEGRRKWKEAPRHCPSNGWNERAGSNKAREQSTELDVSSLTLIYQHLVFSFAHENTALINTGRSRQLNDSISQFTPWTQLCVKKPRQVWREEKQAKFIHMCNFLLLKVRAGFAPSARLKVGYGTQTRLFHKI